MITNFYISDLLVLRVLYDKGYSMSADDIGTEVQAINSDIVWSTIYDTIAEWKSQEYIIEGGVGSHGEPLYRLSNTGFDELSKILGTPKDTINQIKRELNLLYLGGYLELSYDKVQVEYAYMKKRIGRILTNILCYK